MMGCQLQRRGVARYVDAAAEGIVLADTTRPYGQPPRRVGASRAERLFGFRARPPFDVGLCRTVEWYRTASQEAQAR